jgi:hypothetical protein
MLPSFARATENGITPYPIGLNTVMPGMYPHPRQTWFSEYTSFYEANETDNSKGKSASPEFRVRAFANAPFLNHTWGIKLFGGNYNTSIAVPVIYEQLHVVPGKFEKFAIGNVDFSPFAVVYHRGIAHFYYSLDAFTPGTGYSKNDVLNIGTHYLSVGPVFAITLLPNKGQTEISTRTTYLFNGPDKDTHYHSGNEYYTEFNVDRSISKKVAFGVNGSILKQTTDDKYNNAIYEDGHRARNLTIGPQVRFPVGHHGGVAFRYSRDTLVQNWSRGNQFWFQVSVPFSGLSRKE